MEVKKNDRIVYRSNMYDVKSVIVTLIDNEDNEIQVEQKDIEMIYSRQYQSKINNNDVEKKI